LGVSRAVYPQDDLALVFLTSTAGGIVQGDRLQTHIRVGAGARVLVTTQGATRVYRCPDRPSQQCLSVDVAAGGWLEFLPDPAIPFAGADFCQTVRLTVAEDATLVYADILTAGRAARGERFAYRRYRSELVAERPDGELLFFDRVDLEPQRCQPTAPWLLDGLDALGTLIVLHADSARILDLVRGAAAGGCRDLAWGATVLPNGAGVLMRALGARSAEVQALLWGAWSAARAQLAGVTRSLPALGKW
jgi:urease accessory protein